MSATYNVKLFSDENQAIREKKWLSVPLFYIL